MGARLYNPNTGRFMSRDPVEGGNDNTFTYPADPANSFDLDGQVALQERLARRRPLGFRGAEPNMTVQELGEYWMRRRLEEAWAPTTEGATGERQGDGVGSVSMQTLAGYQTALSQIINPRLGGLRLIEARAGVVDEVLARVDHAGRTTRVARSVLAQMFAMAVRHDALTANPMREVRRPPRRGRAVQALSVEQARDLLELTQSHRDRVARDERGLVLGGRPRSPDLHDVVLLLLGTGMRIGGALALEWADLDLDADVPCVRVDATMVEPRRDAASGQVFVAELHRQPMTKTGAARTIALPCAVVGMLSRRRAGMTRQHGRQPVFAHAGGGWLWPNNVRTKLRGVVADTPLAGVSPHTLRRTVGTLVAHSAGLDAARDVLGHRDPSVTARHYIADTGRVIDVRRTLEPIFA
jgi:integrase